MAMVEHALVKHLQKELGRRRQAALEARRALGEAELGDADALQFGKALIHEVVGDYESTRAEQGYESLSWSDRQDLVEALEARLFGAGQLQLLLADAEAEDIVINGYRDVFVTRVGGKKVKLPPVVASNEELIEAVQLLAVQSGYSARAFDNANPRVTLRLPDGSRLHAVQAVTGEPSVSIRMHRHTNPTLEELMGLGLMEAPAADFLRSLVRARKNIMLAGETASGKTTTLRALANEIPPEERLITVERSVELGLHEDVDAHPDCVAFEEREPNAEGRGHEPLKNLVKDSLRMRPDRVIVGEVLGDEIVTMLNAMTQGNDGSLSTIHSNSSLDVIDKIATYAIQAPERLPWEATVQLINSALDFIVFLKQVPAEDGGKVRVVHSIREIRGMHDDRRELTTNEVFKFVDGRLEFNVAPACAADLEEAGWNRGAAAALDRELTTAGGRWV